MKNLSHLPTIMVLIVMIGMLSFEWNALQSKETVVSVNSFKRSNPKFAVKEEDKVVVMVNSMGGVADKNVYKIATGLKISQQVTGISPPLMASVLKTESDFKKNAISPKGYKGMAQTPTATMEYEEVDILHGAMILRDKIHIANGNVLKGLALYKGGDNPLAWKLARETYDLYKSLEYKG